MSHHTLSIAPGVIIEHVGADVVVMLPGFTEVIKLSGDAAHTLRNIQAGDVHVLPSEAVSELVHRGIVVSQAGMSRRGLITAVALGAGAGIVMLSMPAAAAAGSGPESNGGSNDAVAVEERLGFLIAADWGEPVGDEVKIAQKLGLSVGDWVGLILVTDAPYVEEDLDFDNPTKGRVETGGKTYEDTYLFPSSFGPLWFFKGAATNDPDFGDDFVLTFVFDGKPYRVVEGADSPFG
jgi:hypothetical protein